MNNKKRFESLTKKIHRRNTPQRNIFVFVYSLYYEIRNKKV